MGAIVLADETKQRGYQLVAVSVGSSSEVAHLRAVVRGLVLSGQARLHMKKESEPRKRLVASAIVATGYTAVVYNAGRSRRTELEARAACLSALVDDLAGTAAPLLVLEQDDSLLSWDRQRLVELSRTYPGLRYEHRRAREEPALAIPDAIAWCWAKGGDWRRRIAPAVSQVRLV
ncbi:hypothetical protein GCM10009547_46250 [Sporichthya brevicatena]|uniref:Uncharacterized protein n=1 Tax=Sporichthya brevicatena TaxID=171442 RepID=A0ABN1HCF8_9ACTN